MGISLREMEGRGLLGLLADHYASAQEAVALLARTKIEAGAFPPFGQPSIEAWWRHVARLMEKGLGGDDSLRRLLENVAREYPRNDDIRGLLEECSSWHPKQTPSRDDNHEYLTHDRWIAYRFDHDRHIEPVRKLLVEQNPVLPTRIADGLTPHKLEGHFFAVVDAGGEDHPEALAEHLHQHLDPRSEGRTDLRIPIDVDAYTDNAFWRGLVAAFEKDLVDGDRDRQRLAIHQSLCRSPINVIHAEIWVNEHLPRVPLVIAEAQDALARLPPLENSCLVVLFVCRYQGAHRPLRWRLYWRLYRWLDKHLMGHRLARCQILAPLYPLQESHIRTWLHRFPEHLRHAYKMDELRRELCDLFESAKEIRYERIYDSLILPGGILERLRN